MKLVLRKIYLSDIKRKILEIDLLTKPALEQVGSKSTELHIMEVQKAALELKEKIIQNNKVIPLVVLKDTPSIALTRADQQGTHRTQPNSVRRL